MDLILQPWPWFVSGPAIALVLFLLLMVGKRFGMSSNLRTACAIMGAGKKTKFFDFDWKAQRWGLVVVLGAFIGGYIGHYYLSESRSVELNPETIKDLEGLGFKNAGEFYMPEELFSIDAFSDIKVLALLILGGFLVGFGTRYAGGCTSGHAISGLSNLQVPSLIAVIGFFIGGLTMIHLIFPLIF
jgi:uncharacterized membrane protein YedE/YeeE